MSLELPAQSMLYHAADSAFENMGRNHLEILYSALELEVEPPPNSDKTYCKACAEACIPHASEEHIADILERRKSVLERRDKGGAVLPADAATLDSDAEDSDDDDDITKAFKIMVGKGGKAAPLPGASDAPLPTRKPQLPRPIDWESDNPSRDEAAHLIPCRPGCRVQKAELWHHRWRIYYPYGPQQVYSEPLPKTISPLQALKTLLKEIW